jgi:3-methyladenine DNA glycosylase AlkD
MDATALRERVLLLTDPERGTSANRFFKTAPGESGEGLRFLGLNAPQMRSLAKEFRALPLPEIEATLQSEWHEVRAIALLIMVLQFAKADAKPRKALYDCYLANTPRINSWALVDCSAPGIVGAYLLERSRKPLEKLARSKMLWERRIAMVATQHFIRNDDFADTLHIAELLLEDKEDLIHKAAGWMLREVADRDQATAETFLRKHQRDMPRTMLRYAIEKFPPAKRKAYLAGTA